MADTLVVLAFVIGLLVFVFALPLLVGRLWKRHLEQTDPDSEYLKPVRSPDLQAAALFLVGAILLMVTRQVFPASPLGSLLQAPGVAIAAVLLWGVVSRAIGWLVFGKTPR